MSLYDLLPPNSTRLERDLSRAISFIPKLEKGPPIIRTAKRFNYPPSVLPWLVYEYGLGDFTEYFDDLAELIEQGVAWQRIRGTPYSIELAIGWAGVQAEVEEAEGGSYRWSEFQIGLNEVPADDRQTKAIIFLGNASRPARSRLSRIFHGYDFRRFVLNDSLLSGGAILSDHSGVRPEWADGVQLSFGRLHGGWLDANLALLSERSAEHDGKAVLQDTWRLSYGILGGTLEGDPAWHTLNEPITHDRDHDARFSDGGNPERVWGGVVWPAEPWGGTTIIIDSRHDSES